MYPDYRDKPKLFLNMLILILADTTEYGKLFQIATACEKRRNKKNFVQVWGCRRVRGCVFLLK